MTQVATFNLPWRIAFLPDGRMLVTEKVGPIWLVTQQGEKTPVANVPAVLYQGQGGMFAVFLSPHYAKDQSVYITYAEPSEGGIEPGHGAGAPRHQQDHGEPRRTASAVARHAEGPGWSVRRADRLFPRRPVSVPPVGDRQRMTPAQDPNQALGQDPAPDARRQTCAGQSDGRKDGRAECVADQSAA